MLPELSGGEGVLLLEVAAEGVGTGESALTSYVGNGEIGLVGEELGCVGQAAVGEEVDERLERAAFAEGGAYALLGQVEALHECLTAEHRVKVELLTQDDFTELLVEDGVGIFFVLGSYFCCLRENLTSARSIPIGG